MNTAPIKRALISVSDKQGLIPFAQQLHHLGIEIISTGGTCQHLREANIPVMDIAEFTEFPEMMNGRVKTLHPKIHGGILGLRDEHADIATQHNIEWIDLVVVNLYPFSETIQKPSVRFEEAIEQIDIGGPAMIRSAAKNMAFVGVVVDPLDYQAVIDTLINDKQLSFDQRKALAAKAFDHTARYDHLIHHYLSNTIDVHASPDVHTSLFSPNIALTLNKKMDLRYGENPHQKAAAYTLNDAPPGLLNAKMHQGKELSYNNLVDADAAVACVREFSTPACAIIKHANPCGIAVANTPHDAFNKALAADPISAFGGIIAMNRCCNLETALAISKTFFEVIIAPSFSAPALQQLALKPNQRVLEINIEETHDQWHLESIVGGFLMQEKMNTVLDPTKLFIPTQRKPTDDELNALLFAWLAIKHVKSNAIVITKDNQTIGIGAGQVSRIDAVNLAIKKASAHTNGKALASDAFFPFRDSIDHIAAAHIHLIIQPGGSIRDNEVIAACDEHNIAMVFTGTRCFKH